MPEQRQLAPEEIKELLRPPQAFGYSGDNEELHYFAVGWVEHLTSRLLDEEGNHTQIFHALREIQGRLEATALWMRRTTPSGP